MHWTCVHGNTVFFFWKCILAFAIRGVNLKPRISIGYLSCVPYYDGLSFTTSGENRANMWITRMATYCRHAWCFDIGELHVRSTKNRWLWIRGSQRYIDMCRVRCFASSAKWWRLRRDRLLRRLLRRTEKLTEKSWRFYTAIECKSNAIYELYIFHQCFVLLIQHVLLLLKTACFTNLVIKQKRVLFFCHLSKR